MSEDLVQRLRVRGADWENDGLDFDGKLMLEAADEIEKLRAEVNQLYEASDFTLRKARLGL